VRLNTVLRNLVVVLGSLVFIGIWAAIAHSTYRTMRNRKPMPFLGVGPLVFALTEKGRKYSIRSWGLFVLACVVALLTVIAARALGD
jgi:hypothetical protein